jgi:predicted NBD/HSP70 family sugar kinase
MEAPLSVSRGNNGFGLALAPIPSERLLEKGISMEIYGIDLGGTNLRIARIEPSSGEILGEMVTLSMKDIRRNDELNRFIFPHIEDGSHVGISSSGVVNEEELTINFSANTSFTEDITFGRDLRDKKGCRVTQVNDIKAAVQGAARYGEGKEYDNVLLATYSSGFNCALTRKRRCLTTAEFGHTIYKPDGDLFCGCGGKGHLEVYVSGNGAAVMARQYLSIRQLKSHIILDYSMEEINKAQNDNKRLTEADLGDGRCFGYVLECISAKHVYRAFSADPEGRPQKEIREIQVRAIADSFGRMVSVYHPVDIIVLMGSQTKDWDILFVPAIEKFFEDRDNYQLVSLTKPPIRRTKTLEISLKGAVAHHLSTLEKNHG